MELQNFNSVEDVNQILDYHNNVQQIRAMNLKEMIQFYFLG